MERFVSFSMFFLLGFCGILFVCLLFLVVVVNFFVNYFFLFFFSPKWLFWFKKVTLSILELETEETVCTPCSVTCLTYGIT